MFFHKALPYLLYPLTWVILLLLWAFVSVLRARRRAALGALAGALALLFVASNHWVADRLMQSLEQQYPLRLATDLPAADAIVLLGGGVALQGPPRLMPELNNAADRLWFAAELYHAGKAPRIIVSGGQVFPQSTLLSEAEYHVPLLLRLGVPREAILLETDSPNTAGNARNTLNILQQEGIDHILLVTSAYHMRRSMLLFDQPGLNVEPAVCDIRVAKLDRPWLLSVMPSERAFEQTHVALREWMGFAFYRLAKFLG